MNIFPINIEPKICAISSCDQHVVKILAEAVLIYTSAIEKKFPEKWKEINCNYGSVKTPLVNWAEDDINRNWLCFYIYELNNEYEYRYHKKHKSFETFLKVASHIKEIPYKDINLKYPKQFIQLMPNGFKTNNSIEAYKNYYIYKYKTEFKRPMRWTNRIKPKFLQEVS